MLRTLKRALLYLLLLVIAVGAITYVGDYALLRYRVSAQKNPFGQVTVTPYFAIPMKNGNTEFDFQPPENETCTNSLYPHMGMSPCWYLEKHREKRIDVL
jgi:hypothetical protein